MSPEQARGKPRRQARRHLGLRCRALRDADRAAPVRRRDRVRRARGGAHPDTPTTRRCRRHDARERPRPGAALPGARPKAAAARHRRSHDRARQRRRRRPSRRRLPCRRAAGRRAASPPCSRWALAAGGAGALVARVPAAARGPPGRPPHVRAPDCARRAPSGHRTWARSRSPRTARGSRTPPTGSTCDRSTRSRPARSRTPAAARTPSSRRTGRGSVSRPAGRSATSTSAAASLVQLFAPDGTASCRARTAPSSSVRALAASCACRRTAPRRRRSSHPRPATCTRALSCCPAAGPSCTPASTSGQRPGRRRRSRARRTAGTARVSWSGRRVRATCERATSCTRGRLA